MTLTRLRELGVAPRKCKCGAERFRILDCANKEVIVCVDCESVDLNEEDAVEEAYQRVHAAFDRVDAAFDAYEARRALPPPTSVPGPGQPRLG